MAEASVRSRRPVFAKGAEDCKRMGSGSRMRSRWGWNPAGTQALELAGLPSVARHQTNFLYTGWRVPKLCLLRQMADRDAFNCR
jgi:hypothetical protein